MVKLIGVTAFTAILLVGISHHVNADPEDCRNAVDEYNSAASDIDDALRAYAQCVSGSDGHDDCSAEFSNLQSAQDDFETAVSDYEANCS
jgi:hypothetical protein